MKNTGTRGSPYFITLHRHIKHIASLRAYGPPAGQGAGERRREEKCEDHRYKDSVYPVRPSRLPSSAEPRQTTRPSGVISVKEPDMVQATK